MRSLNGLIFSFAVIVIPANTGPKSVVFLQNPAQAINGWRFFENHVLVFSPLRPSGFENASGV
ncbi:Hypothetical protein NGAL_HAMBI1146_00420 [Neorhizobium galegae bv. officinalis]|nr:Hypothetical protein NGAL_HAMBI1146_00420 [Neorhizobium galegae bv. officinalis]